VKLTQVGIHHFVTVEHMLNKK